MIPFNKPFFIGKELEYIQQAVKNDHTAGNGPFTKKCQNFFEERYNIKKAILTTSCTDALEMSAILADIQQGDEVIIPSYTFVSTAIAFVRQGAKIIFADSRSDNPNIDEDLVENLITPKTKAIVVVHYGGIACDMDKIMQVAEKYQLIVIEDAAQAIDSYYKNRPLGSIGHFGTFSFHETKNIISGEGGLLAVNDDRYIQRAEIIWEKGTNRADFFRGRVNKYGWVDIGSSFLPSEITAAFLWAQLENINIIQSKRKNLWLTYHDSLIDWSLKTGIKLPYVPDFASNNGHLFYIVCNTHEDRTALTKHLKSKSIESFFHYLSLHRSEYYKDKYKGGELLNADRYTDCLLRLPLFYEITDAQFNEIIKALYSYKL